MENPIKLSQTQFENLLNSMAKQLNCSPEMLRSQLQNGNFNGIASSVGADANQLQQLLKNPQQLQKTLNSPEMKELLRRISSGK